MTVANHSSEFAIECPQKSIKAAGVAPTLISRYVGSYAMGTRALMLH